MVANAGERGHLMRSKELHILPLLFDILETHVPRQM